MTLLLSSDYFIVSLVDLFIKDCFLLHHLIDFEVVVSKGKIREKPSSKEEARSFIKGVSYRNSHSSLCKN